MAVVKRGRVLFEMGGVGPQVAKEALRMAAHKLPISTKFVMRSDLGSEEHEGGSA